MKFLIPIKITNFLIGWVSQEANIYTQLKSSQEEITAWIKVVNYILPLQTFFFTKVIMIDFQIISKLFYLLFFA